MQNQWPYRHPPIFQNMLIIFKLLSPLYFFFLVVYYLKKKKKPTGHKTQCKDLTQTPPAAPVLPFPAESAHPGSQGDDWLARPSEKQSIRGR